MGCCEKKKSFFAPLMWVAVLLVFAWATYSKADQSHLCRLSHHAKSAAQGDVHLSVSGMDASSAHRCCVKRLPLLPVSEVVPLNAPELKKSTDILPKFVAFSPQSIWREPSSRMMSTEVIRARGGLALYQFLGRLLI